MQKEKTPDLQGFIHSHNGPNQRDNKGVGLWLAMHFSIKSSEVSLLMRYDIVQQPGAGF